MNLSPDTDSRLTRFFQLAGIQFILASGWTLSIALSQHLRTTTLLAVMVMLAGLSFLAVPIFLKARASYFLPLLSGRQGQFVSLAVPILISAFFFLRHPNIDALRIISPILAAIWLVGIEILFFFQPTQEPQAIQNTSSRWSLASILIGYGILLIPSRVPSLLDGFPWNTPLEFVAATLILPLAFFFGRSFLSKRIVTALLALMLVLRLTLSFFLPQSGLGVHAYSSEEALRSDNWERTYASFFDSSYSEVMRLPYRSFYDLPIEYINSHGFDNRTFWLAVKFNGAISLSEEERLVVLVQGASERQIELVDSSGTVTGVETAKSVDDLNADIFNEIPYVGNSTLQGTILFTSYGNARFEPVILGSDGSARPAFSKIYLSPSAFDFPVAAFQFIQNLFVLVLACVILFGLFAGILDLFWAGILDTVDLYLALTGFVIYYIADAADKPGIHILFIAIVIILAVIKFLDFMLRSRSYSNMGYLFAIGIPVLLMFLPLDIHNLQSVIVLPQFQDVSEYQMLARNIYVGGDAFLFKSPPWAYKVLYPYVIGVMHILFGQSLAAQFYLNVWSALLSVLLMVEVAVYFGLSKRTSFVAANATFLLFLLPVSFIYFFRFGLIEPLAIMTLLLGAYFAKEGKFVSMFATGLVTGMLRLNFAGAIFTSITFLAPALTGGFSQAWVSFINWCRRSWKRLSVYLIAIPLPSLLIAFVYMHVHPGYTLTHEMNDQTSVWSVLMSVASVIVGGDQEFLHNQIRRNPLDLIMITLPILSGLLVALISLIHRKGIFAKIDLRLSLFLLSMLPVYAVLKPIGYFPRYSWSFLPPALILLGLVFQFLVLRDNASSQEAQ
ncbi:MAG: hypothetical protein H6634_09425 [Anaerolineales bacterium]|nr:hypothetical protein [Anaerolineales bacterium]